MATEPTKDDQVSPKGLQYDAAYILAFGSKSPDKLPEAQAGEIILYWPGGTLRELLEREGLITKDVFKGNPLFGTEHKSYQHVVRPGTYCIRLPIKESAGLTLDESMIHAQPNEKMTPIALVLACCLCHKALTDKSLILNLEIRCSESLGSGSGMTIQDEDGRLLIQNNAYDNIGDNLMVSLFKNCNKPGRRAKKLK